VIEAPRALALPPRLAALAHLARQVTEAPWALTVADHRSARNAGLADDEMLHAVVLAAFFGHLNRIADATAVPLDYEVELPAPHAEPRTPPFPPAPIVITGTPALDLGRRRAAAAALATWRSYVFERDAPLTRRHRTAIARWVALWLGDGSISSPADLTANPLDSAIRDLAETVTLAPWRLGDRSFTALRAVGFDDAALFDVCAVASSAGMFSRITVALAALGREPA